jgi:type II secretory pathway predicted ATPase ExeA
MSNLSDKTTVYLNPSVKKFLQHKAIAESRSVSEIINEAFADMLEDLEDLKEIEKRRNEPSVPFEVVLKDLGLT